MEQRGKREIMREMREEGECGRGRGGWLKILFEKSKNKILAT